MTDLLLSSFFVTRTRLRDGVLPGTTPTDHARTPPKTPLRPAQTVQLRTPSSTASANHEEPDTMTSAPETPANRPRRIVLTVEEAAHELGIGRTLMYSLVTSGEVESISIGRLRRVPADALNAYINRLRNAPTTTDGKAA